MKKILILAAVLLMGGMVAVSCKKENPPSGNTPSGSYEPVPVSEISVASSFSVAANVSSALININLNPIDASVDKDLSIRCEQPSTPVIDYYLGEAGIVVTPRALGTATLTVSPKSGPASEKTCTVTVTEVPVDPKSISYRVGDDHFQGRTLLLSVTESYKVQAVIFNEDLAESTDFSLLWSVTEGEDIVDVDSASGLISAKGQTGSANVKIEVVNFPNIYAIVPVKVLPAPTSLEIQYFLFPANADGEVILKEGLSTKFQVKATPSETLGGVEVTVSSSTLAGVSYSGGYYEVTGRRKGSTPVTITVKSRYNPSLKIEIPMYVYEYIWSDVKPGDYVYTNGTQFISRDCGLRYVGSPMVYLNSSNKRVTTSQTFPGQTIQVDGKTWNYIGPVVTTKLPDDEDFMEASFLGLCREPSSPVTNTMLYMYRNFRKSNLVGFKDNPSVHALVIRKDEIAQGTWNDFATTQQNDGEVSSDMDKTDGQYQNPLAQIVAFSKDAYDKSQSGTNYHYTKYFTSGATATQVLNMYSLMARSDDFRVNPVLKIKAYSDVPQYGTSCSGWFLPGPTEWSQVLLNLPLVRDALNKTVPLNGPYWSMEEADRRAYTYKFGLSGVSEYDHKLEFKTKNTVATRAMLYL